MTILLEAILSRRSVGPRHLTGPDLTGNELDALARAASAAPDHGGLCPLRLVHIPAQYRMDLAGIFAKAALEADPQADEATVQAARERAMAGPALIAVLARLTPNHSVVPVEEQWISVGAGLQNVLLTALSLGLHAKPLSGKRLRSSALRGAFRLTGDSHLATFIALGRYDGPHRHKPRPDPDRTLQIWTPDEEF